MFWYILSRKNFEIIENDYVIHVIGKLYVIQCNVNGISYQHWHTQTANSIPIQWNSIVLLTGSDLPEGKI